MDAINLADAKTHLSERVDRIEAGEFVDIIRRGKKVARLPAVITPRAGKRRRELAVTPTQSCPAACW